MDPNNPMLPPMDPRQMAAQGMPNPFMPPAPPPPVSPSMGFQPWASDAQNAHKVVPAMTAPDAPLQPNAGQMASAKPPQQPPMASSAPPSQLGNDQAELQRLQKNGAGANQIHNGFLRGLAKVGDVAESILAPGVAALTPGTTNHNMLLQQRQQGRVAQDQAALQANAQLADTQSQTTQRASDAAKKDAQADSYQPIMLTAEQAAAIGHPELAGEGMPSKTYATMLTGKQKTDSTERVAAGKNETTKTVAQGRNETQTSIATARDQRTRDIADARNKTAVLMQGMRDNTSRANTGDRIAAGADARAEKQAKVPADVTKRAALASNVNENADAVEKILSKRSDIVGAAGGRYTSVQQMIGSDDPDIQELGVRMHNIALASNGAHGLRSAEAVAQTEHELFNNFKTGPNGIKGALTGTRQSVQTFLDDEKNFQTSGRRTGNPMQPPTQSAAPSGSQALTDNGVTYHIPANMVAEFKKDHPNAR